MLLNVGPSKVVFLKTCNTASDVSIYILSKFVTFVTKWIEVNDLSSG